MCVVIAGEKERKIWLDVVKRVDLAAQQQVVVVKWLLMFVDIAVVVVVVGIDDRFRSIARTTERRFPGGFEEVIRFGGGTSTSSR